MFIYRERNLYREMNLYSVHFSFILVNLSYFYRHFLYFSYYFHLIGYQKHKCKNIRLYLFETLKCIICTVTLFIRGWVKGQGLTSSYLNRYVSASIITAAHCFVSGMILKAEDLRVGLGSLFRSYIQSNESSSIYSVSRIFTNED